MIRTIRISVRRFGTDAVDWAMGDFKKLLVWGKAMNLVEVIYRVTRQFPPAERFGLTQQLQRAAVSVVSNIAEGEGRRGDRESARYLDVARGSLHEVECQLFLAIRLEYVPADSAQPLLESIGEVSRMLNALIRYRRH